MGRREEGTSLISFGTAVRNLHAVIYDSVTCPWFPLIFITICIPPFLFLLWITTPWKTSFPLQTSQQSVWSSQIFATETPSPLVPYISLWLSCLRLWVTRKAEAQLVPLFWRPSSVISISSILCCYRTRCLFFTYIDLLRCYLQGSIKVNLSNLVLFFFCFFSCSSHSLKFWHTYLAQIFLLSSACTFSYQITFTPLLTSPLLFPILCCSYNMTIK